MDYFTSKLPSLPDPPRNQVKHGYPTRNTGVKDEFNSSRTSDGIRDTIEFDQMTEDEWALVQGLEPPNRRTDQHKDNHNKMTKKSYGGKKKVSQKKPKTKKS